MRQANLLLATTRTYVVILVAAGVVMLQHTSSLGRAAKQSSGADREKQAHPIPEWVHGLMPQLPVRAAGYARLLESARLQKELGLNSVEQDRLKAWSAELAKEQSDASKVVRKARNERRKQGKTDRESLKAILDETVQNQLTLEHSFQQQLQEILGKKTLRLRQIYLQAHGISVLARDPGLEVPLNLSPEQSEAIDAIQTAAIRKHMSEGMQLLQKRRLARQDLQKEPRNLQNKTEYDTKIRERIKKAKDENAAAAAKNAAAEAESIYAVLSSRQRAAFERMLGERWDFLEK